MDTPADTYMTRAAVLKALGHPSRLLMLEALVEGELCVCDLQSLVGSDLSTVSKHLSLLREAGLVQSRKDGLWVYYRLVAAVPELLDAVDRVLGVARGSLPSVGKARC
jgi:ArsR family transcriptional regulator